MSGTVRKNTSNKKSPFWKQSNQIRRFGQTLKSGLILCAAAGLFATLTGCASSSTAYVNGYEVADPLEDVNRATFAFNEAVDKTLIEPVARGYRYAVPRPARTGVRNFLRNLRTPINAANNLLQGDVEGMAAEISRAMINTTIGIGGLIDVAKDTGIEYKHEDFGQTMGRWGVGHGAYLVLPLIGSSSLRDATGMAVDSYADPVRLYLYNTDQNHWNYYRTGATVIDKREELLDVIDDLRRNSFDYYAALRSVYIQRRAAMVRNEDPDLTGSSFAIPNYDDDDSDY